MKTTEVPNEPALSRNNSSRSASSRNNNSRPASRKNNGNNEINRFGVGENNVEHAKKLGKLKSKKTSKSRNSAKSRKKLSKSKNSTNFNTTEVGPKFLIPNARTIFNHLQLAFIEALILQHFNPEYYIWIETDASSFAIGGVLS